MAKLHAWPCPITSAPSGETQGTSRSFLVPLKRWSIPNDPKELKF